jgi:HlyD family type I secretion membrane fusion protein
MRIIPAPAVPYALSGLNRFGLFIFLFGILGSLGWATYTPLDSAVVAQGKVKVLSQKKQVQHLEGGIVESIHITEGERVKANQVLLTLDQTFAGSEYHRLAMKDYELRFREMILLAERDMKQALALDTISATGVDANWAAEQKANALSLFYISRSSLDSQLAISESRLEQLHEQLVGLEQEKVAKLEQLGFMDDEIESWKVMVERKMANKLRYLEIQRDAAELRGIIAKVSSQTAEVKVKIGEVKLDKLSLTQTYQEKAAKELRDVKFSLEDLSKQLETAGNVLGRVDIRAPVDGVVVSLDIHTVGAVIKPGQTLMEIVPSEDSLIIEAKVSPTDVDQVYPGMAARIRISSYKRHELPELEGNIESISADVIEDEQAQTQYFLARISISRFITDSEVALDSSLMKAVQPGMPAEVMIGTGTSTPAQYLMEPLLNAFNKAWRDG